MRVLPSSGVHFAATALALVAALLVSGARPSLARQPAGPGGACAIIAGDQVFLYLRAGGCGPVALPSPPAPDIPPGEILLALPRYPGAALTSLTMTPFLSSTPLDPYLKGASALLLAPGAAPQAVLDWYGPRLARLGYTRFGGSSTNVEGIQPQTHTATTQYFAGPGEAFRNGVDVQVEDAITGGTLLLLNAHMTTPPPRPPASRIPSDLRSLAVVFGSNWDDATTRQWAAQTGSTFYRSWRRTLRDGPLPARLARLINAMPVWTGISNGTLDPYWATLTFHTRGGRAMVFTERTCCAGVQGSGVTLDDTHGALWAVILAAAPAR